MTAVPSCELCHHVPVIAMRSWHCDPTQVPNYSCLFPGLCVLVCRQFREVIKHPDFPGGVQEGPPQLQTPLRWFTLRFSSRELAKEYLLLLWPARLIPQKATLSYSPEIPQSHFGKVVLLSDHLS